MLDPAFVLKVPPFEELGIDAFVQAKRQSFEKATTFIRRRRSELLVKEAIHIPEVSTAQQTGRLLLYDPMETVTDGAAAASSRGFFDVEDAPPWDTWFWYAEGTIFCWVPEPLLTHAQAGIDANPVDCIRWADWSKTL